MLFPFFFFKLQRGGRNVDGKMNLRGVGRGVEKRSLHRSRDVALHFATGARLQVFLDRIPGQEIGWPDIAIAAAGADIGSSALHFHLQGVATSFGGNGGLVAEEGVLILILSDSFETAEQVIGIEDDKPTGTVGELIQNLLVVRGAGRKWGNDLPGLSVGTVEAVVICNAAGGSGGATSLAATAGTASSPAALTTAAGSTSTSSPAASGSPTAAMTSTSASTAASTAMLCERGRFSKG